MGVSLCGGLRCTQATHAGLFNPPGLLGGIRENTLLQNIDIAPFRVFTYYVRNFAVPFRKYKTPPGKFPDGIFLFFVND